MAKIKPITEKELIAAVNEEGLGVGHPFETELDMGCATKEEKEAQIPGTIGVTRNASDAGYLCYTVDENHKMTKCSSHNTWEEAYGMALRRYREFAAVEHQKPDGPSFHYGPISDSNSPLRKEMEERLAQTQSRKQIHNWYKGDKDSLFFGYDVLSTFRNTHYMENLIVGITNNKTVIHNEDMIAGCMADILAENKISAQKIEVKFHDNYSIAKNFMIYEGRSDNWIEINYKADRRPERQNYLPIFTSLESAVSREQELEQGNSEDIEFANAIANISQEEPEMKQ